MKLKIKSLYNEIKDSLYLTIFIIVPLIIILNCTNIKNIIIPFIILVIFITCILKQNKKIIILSLLLITIFLIPIILNEITYKKFNNNFNNKPFNDKCEIIDIIEYQTYKKITFKKNKIYFFGQISNNLINEKLLIGMDVKLIGTLTKPNEFFLDKDFNYRLYLKNQKLVGIIKIEKIQIISKNIILKKDYYKNINLFLSRYIDEIHNYESKSFVKNLTLGSNSLNNELKNNLNKMGISHLFVISGMHFSLLIILFDKLFKLPLFNKIKSKKTIKLCYLFLYVITTKFSISIVRCFIQNIIKMYNDKLKLNKFNQFTLSLIIAIIIQPLSIFNTSFHLTYLISGSIVLLNDLLNKQKNKLIQTVILTSILNLIILPFISNFNGEINLLIILFNIIYIPIVSYIMFPLAFLILIFPFLNKIYYILYQIFIKSISFLRNSSFINIFNITLPKITPFIILIYYIVLIIFLKSISIKKKQTLSFVTLLIVLIIWNNFGYFKNNTTCEFVNVKIGDVTIIKEKHLKK